jgi:hypothetical protein
VPDTAPTTATRYIACKSGRPHRCRSTALPSNPKKPGRPARGKAVEFLRRYLTGIAKRSGGARPWTEIDLNRCFNSQGYSLSWGRETFRRLQRDPFWRNLCKVRFIQKRLTRNGCFVILLAFRPYLRWDEEPLFYAGDRKTTRHVRAALRGEDLEHRDCPVSNTSTKRTAVEFNNPSDRIQQSGSAVVLKRNSDAELTPAGKTPSNGQNSLLRLSLNNQEPPPEVQKAINAGLPSPALTSGAVNGTSFNPQPTTHNIQQKPISPALRKFVVWLSFSLAELTWTHRVPFSFATVYAFAKRHAIDGHTAIAIQSAWKRAVEMTHADAVDSDGLPKGQSFCRKPIALCVAHATRILFRCDNRTADQRRADFFAERAKVKPMSKPLEPNEKGEKEVANE